MEVNILAQVRAAAKFWLYLAENTRFLGNPLVPHRRRFHCKTSRPAQNLAYEAGSGAGVSLDSRGLGGEA